MLRTVLVLALAALTRGDYLLSQIFPFPAEGCVGEPQPSSIFNGACYPFIYKGDGELAYYSPVACNSQTSYNISYYRTASCTGTPFNVITEDVNVYNGCKDGPSGFTNMVCVPGTFSPATPLGPSLFYLDNYYVSEDAPGAATCPPGGDGVTLIQRVIIDATGQRLNTCTRNTNDSYILSCNSLNAFSLRVQLFGTLDCSGPEQPSGYDDRGCTNQSFGSLPSFSSFPTGALTEPIPYRSRQVLFLNAGTQCLSPPPTPPAAAAAGSLSPAGLIGIGAGGGLAVAALAFAAHALYRRYRPLSSSAAPADRARSLPLTANSRETAAAAASTPLLASGKSGKK